MTNPVLIDYVLGQHGWASFNLTIGEATIKIGDFGYCTDALGDLVRTALVIASSGLYAAATFDGEPAGWRLILTVWRDSPSQVRMVQVQVRTLPDASLDVLDTDVPLIFEASTEAENFGRAVLVATQSLWERFGADGYVEVWQPYINAFPLRAYRALELAISITEPPLFGGAFPEL